MLTGISQENCSIVSNRIEKDFQNRTGNKKNVQIDYYVASVREVCDDVSSRKEKSFQKTEASGHKIIKKISLKAGIFVQIHP